MHIDVTFKNMDATDALHDYATKRLSKLDRYLDRPTEAHMVLSVEKKLRHKADVTLNADGVMVNAVEITEDMYSAIDMVMDKVERQVKKHREKIREKARTRTLQEGIVSTEAEPGEPRVIQERDYFVKPMNVEEAVMQLDMAEQDFIIFEDTTSQQINLLYRRKDGDLGLIIPQS